MRPAWVRVGVVATGVCLFLVTAAETVLWWAVLSVFEPSFIAGVLMSVPASLLLAVGGYRLPRTAVPEGSYLRIGLITAAGGVVLGAFSLVTGLAVLPDFLWVLVGSLRWGVSVGAGVGFLVGFFNARSIERAVSARVAAVRAEETEQQREFLTYINGLLRHEVLNTANVIEGHAELAEEATDDADRARRLGVVKRQTDELSAVIEDVRFLTEVATEDAHIDPVDLRTTLERELRTLRDRHDGVETSLSAPESVWVEADPLLRRVFSNLLANAVEHNDAERPRVSVVVSTAPETVTVEVRDNGLGVPEGVRERLFDPAVRKDTTHGLGLQIVSRLVARYDGSVELAESGPEGTTVAVTLHRSEPADD